MASPTTNFGWLRPTVGGDNDIWGDELNSNLTNQDSLVRRAINTFIASTAPAEFQSGTMWIDNSVNPWSIKIYDGTSWLETGTINSITHSYSPSGLGINFYVGDYKFSAQNSNHGSWLLCNGSAVSTTTYSGLFAIIGYAFGGSGATFNLPDMRGRVPAAIGTGTGLSTRILGQTLGEENHVLTTGELAAHTHYMANTDNGVLELNLNPDLQVTWRSSQFDYALTGSATTSTLGKTSNVGSSTGHNTMQPTQFVGNYFIYSGV